MWKVTNKGPTPDAIWRNRAAHARIISFSLEGLDDSTTVAVRCYAALKYKRPEEKIGQSKVLSDVYVVKINVTKQIGLIPPL